MEQRSGGLRTSVDQCSTSTSLKRIAKQESVHHLLFTAGEIIFIWGECPVQCALCNFDIVVVIHSCIL